MGVLGLDKALTELIKVKPSQVNGCSFCVQFQLNAARTAKVSQMKLDLVAYGMRQASSVHARFAAFEWSEALIRVTSAGVTNECYQDATKESELAISNRGDRLDQCI